MLPKPPSKSDNPEQSRQFIDMAREVETDESPEAPDRAFARVVPAKNQPPAKEGEAVIPDTP